mmetsp:Transcript_26509/g.75276  ORF Transcript_26509/g.75276 Transcript_26509/m.75276 type:complete len:391 (+) Transcript_26509:1154-2326(+)
MKSSASLRRSSRAKLATSVCSARRPPTTPCKSRSIATRFWERPWLAFSFRSFSCRRLCRRPISSMMAWSFCLSAAFSPCKCSSCAACFRFCSTSNAGSAPPRVASASCCSSSLALLSRCMFCTWARSRAAVELCLAPSSLCAPALAAPSSCSMAWTWASVSLYCLASRLSCFSTRSASWTCRCAVLLDSCSATTSRSSSEHLSACQPTPSMRSVSCSMDIIGGRPSRSHLGLMASNFAEASSTCCSSSAAMRLSSACSASTSVWRGAGAASPRGGGAKDMPSFGFAVGRGSVAAWPTATQSSGARLARLTTDFRRSPLAFCSPAGLTMAPGSSAKARSCRTRKARTVRPWPCAACRNLCCTRRKTNCASERHVTQPGLRSSSSCCRPRNH